MQWRVTAVRNVGARRGSGRNGKADSDGAVRRTAGKNDGSKAFVIENGCE
jgi:hypothetical protein